MERRAAWRAVATLTSLLFALRAMVPAGYMPDPAALADGRLAVTLCTAEGYRTILVGGFDGIADPDGSVPPTTTSADDCPFAATSIALLRPDMVRIAPVPRDAFPAPAPRHTDLQAPTGPPLGARAPPTIVG